MPAAYPRQLRVAAALRREAAALLSEQLRDPRLRFATLTGAEVSGDLREARLYVSFLSDDPRCIRQALLALRGAEGFVRSALARRLKLRHMPALQFVYDDLPARGLRLEALIARGLG